MLFIHFVQLAVCQVGYYGKRQLTTACIFILFYTIINHFITPHIAACVQSNVILHFAPGCWHISVTHRVRPVTTNKRSLSHSWHMIAVVKKENHPTTDDFVCGYIPVWSVWMFSEKSNWYYVKVLINENRKCLKC